MFDKLCGSCKIRAAVKKVKATNGRNVIWKCQTCIEKRSHSQYARKSIQQSEKK